MAVKMTVKVRKRKSNSMRLPIAVVEITSKRLQFFKIFWGACPQTPLCGPSADIKFGLPLSKSWLKACPVADFTYQ